MLSGTDVENASIRLIFLYTFPGSTGMRSEGEVTNLQRRKSAICRNVSQRDKIELGCKLTEYADILRLHHTA